MTTTCAALLAETASAGPLAILAVTAALLLLLAAVFWSFLRRARREGVAPLAVDRLEPPRLAEPADPRMPSTETADDARSVAAQVETAIEDDISEGGPADGAGS